MIPDISEKRLITYGFSASADIRAINLKANNGVMCFDVMVSDRIDGISSIPHVTLPMPGKHNVLNCLAAIAVALEMGVDIDKITTAIATFKAWDDVLTIKAQWVTSPLSMITGITPVEISAVLGAARMLKPNNKVIAVMQPHRYTRLHDLFTEFCVVSMTPIM